ncbi:MAG: von Willebrand factor type A domain-containing protein, partial [Ekhidna sp.]
MKKLLIILSIFWASQSYARTISGTIYDQSGNAISGVSVMIKGTMKGTHSGKNGIYSLEISDNSAILIFSMGGYQTTEKRIGEKIVLDIIMKWERVELEEEEIALEEVVSNKRVFGYSVADQSLGRVAGAQKRSMSYTPSISFDQGVSHNTEEYETIGENGFRKVTDKPLSTFSIDVDAASYSNMRRFIQNGSLPPKDAVRIEEMINYFSYDYKKPTGKDPFSINTELARAPWNSDHLIVQVGLQGEKIEMDNLPASNIVFLLDVSGSMSAPNKLPLLKSAFKMLANELRPQDKVSIVVYAGAAGLVLEPTDGNDKKTIMEALDNLQAGGSTAGGAGINLAYKIAKEQFIEGGNNRVVLATDGDFNVGASSNAEMERLIEDKRKDGVFLTVLGFGMGNYKDSKMEKIADKGNGNYAYIDNMKEAKKVLVNEFGGTMFTIAKDVKIQVEFNPGVVQAYRLIGYENRKLNDEDFNDDKKDAGE